MKVWTYWEGPMPDYIRLCIDTMRCVCGDRFQLVTPDNLDQFVDMSILPNTWKSIPVTPSRVSCIRACLLLRNGGWWVDADSIMLKEPPPDPGPSFVYVCVKKRPGSPINGYFGARSGNKTVSCWVDMIRKFLSNETRIKRMLELPGTLDERDRVVRDTWWLVLGEKMLKPAKDKWGGTQLPLDTFLPMDYSHDPLRLIQPGNWRRHVKRHTICFGLNNSWIKVHALDKLEWKPGQPKLLIHKLFDDARRRTRT